MKLKATILCLLMAAVPFVRVSAQASLEKKWTSDTTLKVPESVYFDAKRNTLYVTNIDGAPWASDGKGSVSKLSPDGKITTLNWVEGLSAPKGMAVVGNQLFVADMGTLIIIDIAKGAITKRETIEGAINLNDVTASPSGVVYVSDSKKKTVHTYQNGKISLLLDSANNGLRGPNGLLYMPDGLLVLDNGALYRAGKDNKLTQLAKIAGGTDGIEHVKGEEFVVSCWGGQVFYVDAKSGTVTKMLDTQAEKLQTADIGYDAKKRIVYIPTFFGNKVSAYQLNVK